MNIFDLAGKKAIVTGAGSGLGKGMAEGLVMAGAEVALIDITDSICSVAQVLGKNNDRVFAVKGDLGDRSNLKNTFCEAVDKLGGTVDILVNSAGVQRRNKCEDFSIEDWDTVIEINLTSVFELCQLAGKMMLERNSGKIINIASLLSFFGGQNVPAYSASKGGVAQLTKALSNEWAQRGINVNAIAPGYMDTSLNTELINDASRNEQILARIPAGRWGTPNDLKGVTIFLASEASNYIHGAIIPVDGGYLAK